MALMRAKFMIQVHDPEDSDGRAIRSRYDLDRSDL
jgi:hypothetical protein